jgi:hypothetical protein
MAFSPDDVKSKGLAKAAEWADYLEKRIDAGLSGRSGFSGILDFGYIDFAHDNIPYGEDYGVTSRAVEAEIVRRYSAKGWKKVRFERCPHTSPFGDSDGHFEFGHLKVHLE